MKRYICVECDKPIRQNSKSAYIHRKCWIKMREKDERYLDFLFVRDKEQKKKVISVRTETDEDDDDGLDKTIEDIKDMINREKPVNYEEDPSITYEVDIGGNIIKI